MTKDNIEVQKLFGEYLISLGFKEKKKSFHWSGEHPVLKKINYHRDGKSFGWNLLSADIRDNCGYDKNERSKMSEEEKEEIYREYLSNKPYYKDIKYGITFYFKKDATDYIGIQFGIGLKRLKNVIEYEQKRVT